MVFNTTFNNISVILWQSVLLVEETGRPGENHRPVTSHWQTLVLPNWYNIHLNDKLKGQLNSTVVVEFTVMLGFCD